MSLLKIVEPGAWDFGEPIAQMVKLSGYNHKLQGQDRLLFIKRAGEIVTDMLDHVKFVKGEIPIHLLALGAFEKYSHNRNGDGFDAHTCRTRHNTFVKYARFYRNHLNRDQAKSYGIVKASAYNEKMSRIELICALNGDEQTALRNGGLLADREMEKLAAGRDIPVSMACMVPFDVCSYCGNQSRTKDDYCDSFENGGKCKAGGLKHAMGKTVEVDGDLHHMGAMNPNCKYFDISHVPRPADRIAYVSGMLKAAAVADGREMSGVEMAEAAGLQMPYELLEASDAMFPPHVTAQMKQAHQLADLEKTMVVPGLEKLAFAADRVSFQPLPAETMQKKFAQVFRALADEKICLSLPEFLQLTAGQNQKQANETAAVLAPALPGSFSYLAGLQNLPQMLADNPYLPARSADESLRSWARKQAEYTSLAEPWFSRRAQLGTLREITVPIMERTFTKAASDRESTLLQHYAMYKLAFLTAIPFSSTADLALTAKRALAQNYVS